MLSLMEARLRRQTLNVARIAVAMLQRNVVLATG